MNMTIFHQCQLIIVLLSLPQVLQICWPPKPIFGKTGKEICHCLIINWDNFFPSFSLNINLFCTNFYAFISYLFPLFTHITSNFRTCQDFYWFLKIILLSSTMLNTFPLCCSITIDHSECNILHSSSLCPCNLHSIQYLGI